MQPLAVSRKNAARLLGIGHSDVHALIDFGLITQMAIAGRDVIMMSGLRSYVTRRGAEA